MTIEYLRKLKKKALEYWKRTGYKEVRACIKKIDKMITEEFRKDGTNATIYNKFRQTNR